MRKMSIHYTYERPLFIAVKKGEFFALQRSIEKQYTSGVIHNKKRTIFVRFLLFCDVVLSRKYLHINGF